MVVDNGPDKPARDVVAECGLPFTYVPSHHNLGGAGGFALGMLHALAMGAEWVWLADDDGRPADENVLRVLLEEAQRRDLAEVSPVVANIDAPEKLAFPLRRGLTWKRVDGGAGHGFPARHRVVHERRVVPGVDAGRGRSSGPAAVRAG